MGRGASNPFCRALGIAIGVQAALCAMPARADSADADAAAAPADPPRITIGRAVNLTGRPIDLAQVERMSASAGSGAKSLPSGMPVAARALTSGFGMRVHPVLGGERAHLGVDLSAPAGTPVVATADGVVGWAGPRGGYGLMVAIEGAAGTETRYGHLSRVNVASGQAVRKGQIIGQVGSTGMSTGMHLHYEVRVNGRPINPLSLLRPK